MGQLLPGARSAGVTTSGEQRPRGTGQRRGRLLGATQGHIPERTILGAEPQVEVCVRFHRKKARSGSKAGAGAAVHLPRTRAQSHPKRARLGLGAAPGSGLTARAPTPGGRRTGAIRFGLALHKALRCKHRPLLSALPAAPAATPPRGRSLSTLGRAAALPPSPRRGGVGGDGAAAESRAAPRARRPRRGRRRWSPGPPYARRPPLRAPARSARRPGLAQRGRGSPGGPGAARRGPGRAAATLAPRPRARHPAALPGRLPFVLEPRPAAALTASERGAANQRAPQARPRPAPRAPPRAPPAPRRSGQGGAHVPAARRCPVGRPSQLGLGARPVGTEERGAGERGGAGRLQEEARRAGAASSGGWPPRVSAPAARRSASSLFSPGCTRRSAQGTSAHGQGPGGRGASRATPGRTSSETSSPGGSSASPSCPSPGILRAADLSSLMPDVTRRGARSPPPTRGRTPSSKLAQR